MIKSRIIVIGATGKTGSVVAAELLKGGYPAAARDSSFTVGIATSPNATT
jgi:hypothetical protein